LDSAAVGGRRCVISTAPHYTTCRHPVGDKQKRVEIFSPRPVWPALNSCQKGKRGERAWRDELLAHGYSARRGQQFSGSPDSPDVVCADLPNLHFEVKAVERLNVYNAMAQAVDDAGGKVSVVAHKRNERMAGHNASR
jgi:hypothetical protein